jgi:hypothetical protein
MLLDETCRFLAVDFDKQSWMSDVAAFRDTARFWRAFHYRSSVRAREMGLTPGSSLLNLCQRQRLAGSVRFFSPQRWTGILTSDSHLTTGFFQARIICRPAASAI